MSSALHVEDWPIEQVIPYERNPRKNQHAVAKVARSINRFGFRQPIVVDAERVVIVGHTRLAAAKTLGLATVPVHVAANMPAADAKAYRIADNRTGEEADWDDALLGLELGDLKALDFDLGLTAFDLPEIEALTRRSRGDESPDVDLTPPAKPKSERGQVYLLGRHRVMCGDCREPSDVAHLLQGRAVNVAVTSPPYASQRDYDESSGFTPIPPDDYVEWFAPVAANVRSALAADGSWFVNIKPSCEGLDTSLYVLDLVIAHVRNWGWHFATEFCWERNGVPKSVTQRFKNQFEPVYQFALGRWKMRPENVRHESENVPRAGGKGVGDTGWANKQGGNGAMFGAAKKRRNGTSDFMSDVQGRNAAPGEYIGPGLAYPGNRLPTFAATHDATGHTAAFPVGLPKFFIDAYTDGDDAVFDPFVGSGSTIIACEQSERVGFGIEISPAYCDVVRRRYAEFVNDPSLAP